METTTHTIEGVGPDGKIKIEPNTTLDFQTYSPPNTPWIIYKSEYGMSSSAEMDQFSDQVPTMGLPEVFYGNNHIFFVNPEKNFMFELSALDAISLSSYAVRDA